MNAFTLGLRSSHMLTSWKFGKCNCSVEGDKGGSDGAPEEEEMLHCNLDLLSTVIA